MSQLFGKLVAQPFFDTFTSAPLHWLMSYARSSVGWRSSCKTVPQGAVSVVPVPAAVKVTLILMLWAVKCLDTFIDMTLRNINQDYLSELSRKQVKFNEAGPEAQSSVTEKETEEGSKEKNTTAKVTRQNRQASTEKNSKSPKRKGNSWKDNTSSGENNQKLQQAGRKR